jgi:hypothetical protein
VPDAAKRPTDMHQMTTIAVEMGATTHTRVVTEVFTSMGNRTVTLGPEINPLVIQNPGNYKLLNTAFHLAAEYNMFVAMTYTPITGARNTITMTATNGWAIAGGIVGLVTPNFTGVTDWNDAWGPPSNTAGLWAITGAGSTHPGSPTACVNGLRSRAASRSGTL